MNNQGLYRSMRRRSSPNNRQQNRKWDSYGFMRFGMGFMTCSMRNALVFHWFSRPPMLINREGSTQSSIAKNFMESGCWLVQGLLIWFWHYIDVCLESSTQSYRLYSHVLQLNHVNSNCKFLYKSPTFCQFNSHTLLATTHIFDIFCRFQSMVSWWIPRNSPIQCQPDPGILIADTPMIDDQYRSKWNWSPELSNPWGYPKQSFSSSISIGFSWMFHL